MGISYKKVRSQIKFRKERNATHAKITGQRGMKMKGQFHYTSPKQ
jgi:hypothetical protein